MARVRRDGVKLVLGPGTGLGVAALVPADGRWHVVASEGGHASFGPQAGGRGRGVRAAARGMRQRQRRARAVGPRSDAALRARLDPPPAREQAPETIVASALAREPSALAATRLFVRLLGRFAGRLALTFKALGGVYITGGVAGGSGRCSTSRSSAQPSRRIRPIRNCSRRSRRC